MESRLHGLDALRGVAAVVVVTFHAFPQMMPAGFLAVDLFFVISGFIMAKLYETRFGRDFSPISFLGKRFLRLFPIAAAGVAIGALFNLGNSDLVALTIAALAMLPAFWSYLCYPLNGAHWSLTAELAANFIHALVLHRLSNRSLLCTYSFLAAIFVINFGLTGELGVAERPEFILGALVRCIAGYIAGVLIYRLQIRVKMPYPALAFVAVIVVIGYAPHWVAPLSTLLIAPVFVAASIDDTRYLWGSVLGHISYPLYAIHYPLITHWGANGAVAAFVISVLLAITLEPGLRPLRQMLKQPTTIFHT